MDHLQKRISFLVAVLLAGNVVLAQEEDPDAGEGPWSGKVTLGYQGTSGNTDTTTYRTGFEVAYATDGWLHQLDAAGNGGEDSGATSAEAYQANWKSSWSFTEHDFVFGQLSWRKDRFAGVTEQVSTTLGYGRRVVDTPSHLLSLEAGLGYRDSDRADGTNETSAIGRGALNYTWTFSETASFTQDLIVETGSDNTFIESVSAVQASLVSTLALVASYTVKRNTDVPVGTNKTDTLTAISLEYGF